VDQPHVRRSPDSLFQHAEIGEVLLDRDKFDTLADT
jgi:hypothetical protein